MVKKIKEYTYKISENHPYTSHMANKFKVDFIDGFILFIQKYGVIALAIGVVMGQAVNQLVTSFVTNVLSPIISAFLGLAFKVDQLRNLEVGNIRYGTFISDFITFVLTAFVVFVIIKYGISFLLSEEDRAKLHVDQKKEEKKKLEEEIKDLKEEKKDLNKK